MHELQARIEVSWDMAEKRWFVSAHARTTEGAVYKTAYVTDPYGCPMTAETVLLAFEYVGLALRQAYPF